MTNREHVNNSGNQGREGFKNRTRDKSHILYFNCEKLGHYASECRAPKKEEEAHLTRTEGEETTLLLAMTTEHHESMNKMEDE